MKDTKIWILGGMCAGLLTLISWMGVHLVDSIETKLEAVAKTATDINVLVTGQIIRSAEIDKAQDAERKEIKEAVKKLQDKVNDHELELVRILGRKAIESGTRSNDKTQYETLIDNAKKQVEAQ